MIEVGKYHLMLSLTISAGNMKFLIVGDKEEPLLYDYFDKSRFPGIDLILSTGDLRPGYLSFLMTMFNKRLYYVRGNHDIIYREEPPKGGRNIDGQIVIYKGTRILGFEGSMWYGGRGIEYRETEMWWKVLKVRPRIWLKRGVDLVLTHAPPKGIHDGKDQCHKGFSSFRNLIVRYQPRYFIHGHQHLIYPHAGEQVTQMGKTQVINCYGYYILENI